jgi:hypothetical protein
MRLFLHLTSGAAYSLLVVTSTLAACPSWPTASRFQMSADGTQVTDNRTGLIWARCSVGQSWSGSTCSGTASTMTHEAALSTAKGQTGWRLPNVMELSSLADRGCQSPAIDGIAFPNTQITYYWSTSPYVRDSNYAWSVHFEAGLVYNYNRSEVYAVRLVRASP